jgi:hypothetical protein
MYVSAAASSCQSSLVIEAIHGDLSLALAALPRPASVPRVRWFVSSSSRRREWSHTAPSEPTTHFHQGGDIWVSRAVSCAMAWLTTVGGGGGGSVYGGEEKGRASRVGSIVLQPHKRQQTDRVARCVAPRPTSVRPTPSTKESGH